MSRTKPEILSRRQVARTRLFRVEELEMRFSNGERRTYEKMCAGGFGAVLVVPLLDAETLLLIREYGVGEEDYVLAFPKGAVDAGESLFEAANRELMEEVGYGARQLHWLKNLRLSPSYMEYQIDVILARDLYPEKRPGDEPEPIEVVPWKLDNIDELLARPDFTEGRSVAALFLAREWLRQNETV